MAKSGQRATYIGIIDRPELKSPIRTMVENLITVLFWSTWGFWMLPLCIMALETAGIEESIFSRIYSHPLSWQKELLVMGLFMGVFAAIALWIGYNEMKSMLRRGERRKRIRSCDVNGLAAHFYVDADHLKRVMCQNNCVKVMLQDSHLILPLVALPQTEASLKHLELHDRSPDAERVYAVQ